LKFGGGGSAGCMMAEVFFTEVIELKPKTIIFVFGFNQYGLIFKNNCQHSAKK
jgi:hypothetical protein